MQSIISDFKKSAKISKMKERDSDLLQGRSRTYDIDSAQGERERCAVRVCVKKERACVCVVSCKYVCIHAHATNFQASRQQYVYFEFNMHFDVLFPGLQTSWIADTTA